MKKFIVGVLIIVIAAVLFTVVAFLLFNFYVDTSPTASFSPATSTPIIAPATSSPSSGTTTTNSGNWIVATTTTSPGIQFLYPRALGFAFVTPVDWPPTVSRSVGTLTCPEGEGDIITPDGNATRFKRQTINGQTYCIAMSDEGAAGSTYTSYQYSTIKDNAVVSVSFILRTPQCMNYDEPKQTACKNEQAEFDVAALALGILASITMK